MVDVAVIGSGPNGLAAAVTLARAGLSVVVHESADGVGGGVRTAELTRPGFLHDICSAAHPMALASPFFRAFELTRRIDLIVPEVSYAHPLDGGRAGVAYRDLERTVDALGADGAPWRRLMGPLLARLDGVVDVAVHPLVRIPQDPVALLSFGMRVLEQGTPLWNTRFTGDVAPAMLTGVAAHAMARLPSVAVSAAGLFLGLTAHAGGWPIPRGGSQAIADALVRDLLAHGGRVVTGSRVTSVAQLRADTGAKAVIANLTPRGLLAVAREELPQRYIRQMESFRYGVGTCKVDFALSGPVPWTNPQLHQAPTIHLGGTREAIARAERAVLAGHHPTDPYVLAVQPGVVDASRAPGTAQTFWAYTHVPAGSRQDQREVIIAQIERFAPGFRELIVASASSTAHQLEGHNANYVGGDIGAGAVSMTQLLKRPVLTAEPWRTPAHGLYLASASTPPGPGVHGMAGYHAAASALRHSFGLPVPQLGVDASSHTP